MLIPPTKSGFNSIKVLKPSEIINQNGLKIQATAGAPVPQVENGYIVIKNAVPKEQAKKTANFLWEFEEKDPNNINTWYEAPRAEMQMKELAGTGMVECYNNQHLWNNRMTQKVYDSFVDIWGTEKLWVIFS